VILWDRRDPRAGFSPTPLPGPKADEVDDLAISGDGRRLVAGSRNGTVRAWAIDDRGRASPPVTLADVGARVEISRDGRWFFAGRFGGKLFRFGDAEPARPRMSFPDWPSVGDATFDPRGNWLATTAKANRVSLCWLSSERPIESVLEVRERYRRPFRGNVEAHGWEPRANALLFSPDGRFLFMGSNDSCIYVWPLKGAIPKDPIQQWRGHTGEVTSLAISDSGRWLLSGSDDGTARLWDLGGTSRPFSVALRSGPWGIRSAAISPDGRWACATDYRVSTTVWPLATDDLLKQARLAAGRNLSRAEWDLYFPSRPFRRTFDDLPVAREVLAGDEAFGP
jgi:WD40 repeat protein